MTAPTITPASENAVTTSPFRKPFRAVSATRPTMIQSIVVMPR
jgi:hypothetical protein